MGYLRPVMTAERPLSFPAVTAQTFQRGCYLWLDSSGNASTTLSGNVPLGISNDDKTTALTAQIINQVLTTTGTLAATGGIVSYSTGFIISDTQSAGTVPASWTMLAGAGAGLSPTVPIATSTTWGGTGNISALTVDVTSAGVINLNITGTGLYTGVVQVSLTVSYTYVRQEAGASIVSDMFNSASADAPLGAGSSLVTVYFMDGVFETDQYDPFVSYAIGGSAYAQTGGLFTSAVGSNSKVGVILTAPATNYNAETKTVSGQAKPKPESLRLLYRPVRP